MDEKLFFRNAAGDGIAALLSTPEKPNGKGVVLLHCFTGTKHHRIMRGLAESLAGSGFSVLRFDFSGNGESGGKIEDATYTRMMGEVREAVSLLRRRGMKKIGVAGHSMGAMLSLISAHEDRRIAAVGFVSGSSQAARVREVFPKEAVEKAEKEGVAHAFVYGREIRLKREFLLDVERYNVGHYAATLGRPILILHGTHDEIIPPFHARQLYAWASEPKTLEMLEGADHLFRNDGHFGKLKRIVCDWFSSHL
jgi:putative redox protein